MGTKKNKTKTKPNQNTLRVCLGEGTILSRVPIDWIYSTRILCIDCQQNTLQ